MQLESIQIAVNVCLQLPCIALSKLTRDKLDPVLTAGNLDHSINDVGCIVSNRQVVPGVRGVAAAKACHWLKCAAGGLLECLANRRQMVCLRGRRRRGRLRRCLRPQGCGELLCSQLVRRCAHFCVSFSKGAAHRLVGFDCAFVT